MSMRVPMAVFITIYLKMTLKMLIFHLNLLKFTLNRDTYPWFIWILPKFNPRARNFYKINTNNLNNQPKCTSKCAYLCPNSLPPLNSACRHPSFQGSDSALRVAIPPKGGSSPPKYLAAPRKRGGRQPRAYIAYKLHKTPENAEIT